jgi:hypothetical protein
LVINRREYAPFTLEKKLQFIAKFPGIDKVTVVGNSYSASPVGNAEGLGIENMGRPCGGITDMAHGKMAFEATEYIFGKYFRNQSHGFMLGYAVAV